MCPLAQLVRACDCYLYKQSQGPEFEPQRGSRDFFFSSFFLSFFFLLFFFLLFFELCYLIYDIYVCLSCGYGNNNSDN